MREWLALFGVLAVAIVVIDGYRRMRLARKRATELSFGLEEVKGSDGGFGSELPNGGARVSRSNSDFDKPARERLEPSFSAEQDTASLNATELYASHDIDELSSASHQAANSDAVSVVEDMPAQNDLLQSIEVDEPVPVLMNLDEPQDLQNLDESLRAEPIKAEFLNVGSAPVNHVTQDENTEEVSVNEQEDHISRDQRVEKLSERPSASEVIIINVLAKGGAVFDGPQLLQSILSSGMRFGDMAIFHRYSHSDGSGKIEFSMANGVEPGYFDIDNLEDSSTPVVSFFMGMPGPENPMQAFTTMEETARKLALDLGGELKDEQFSVMTRQTLEHCRQRIREYERKRLTKKIPS